MKFRSPIFASILMVAAPALAQAPAPSDKPADAKAPAVPVPPGHGIDNTRERLRALYSERASLEITRRPEGGTIATLKLPYRELRPDDEKS